MIKADQEMTCYVCVCVYVCILKLKGASTEQENYDKTFFKLLSNRQVITKTYSQQVKHLTKQSICLILVICPFLILT